MTGELIMHDYIITLIEAAKKATKKLRRKKIKRILEFGEAEYKALAGYLGEKGVIKAFVHRIKELVGTANTDELYTLLFDLATDSDKVVKPENLYLLKPALDAMQDFLRKCEQLAKGGQQQGSNLPKQEDCDLLKDTFKQFVEKYELTKKDTPFYKRWYYWYISLPMWKRILIGFGLLVVVFIILLVVFKVGSKAAGALKKALNGDKVVGKKLVSIANSAGSNVKTAAFGAAMGAVAKKAALYL